MEWWRRIVKRALVAVSARAKPSKDGILKLHNDVQTCEYQDVQVMWEMLQKTEMGLMHAPPNNKRPDWRISSNMSISTCGCGL
uniref:OSJNBa0011F23.6-like protein n=1 Tax=Hyacinthus orientalis TaxID=82025 RepID=Q5YJS0_HYAOR|nr:OSJNBa0011F23.6-like protein [Hyacinthus orientalis]